MDPIETAFIAGIVLGAFAVGIIATLYHNRDMRIAGWHMRRMCEAFLVLENHIEIFYSTMRRGNFNTGIKNTDGSDAGQREAERVLHEMWRYRTDLKQHREQTEKDGLRD